VRYQLALVVLLVLAGCGPATSAAPSPTVATATPTPTPSPTPSPSPTVESVASYFRTLPGYEWVAPPPTLQEAVVKAFSDPALGQYFGGSPEARLVTQRGDPTSLVLLVLPLQPSYAALPGIIDSIVQGYGGAPPQTLTVGGRRALLVVEDPKYAFKSMVWQQRSFVLWLYGFNGVSSGAMTAFAEAVIGANQQ